MQTTEYTIKRRTQLNYRGPCEGCGTKHPSEWDNGWRHAWVGIAREYTLCPSCLSKPIILIVRGDYTTRITNPWGTNGDMYPETKGVEK